jgi:hypothetical protein
LIFQAVLNLDGSGRDQSRAIAPRDIYICETIVMKIALLGLLGLVLGTLGGAALGIGAGLAWTEIFKTSSFEGYSGMLVFFTFMPLGAAMAAWPARCCSA